MRKGNHVRKDARILVVSTVHLPVDWYWCTGGALFPLGAALFYLKGFLDLCLWDVKRSQPWDQVKDNISYYLQIESLDNRQINWVCYFNITRLSWNKETWTVDWWPGWLLLLVFARILKDLPLLFIQNDTRDSCLILYFSSFKIRIRTFTFGSNNFHDALLFP